MYGWYVINFKIIDDWDNDLVLHCPAAILRFLVVVRLFGHRFGDLHRPLPLKHHWSNSASKHCATLIYLDSYTPNSTSPEDVGSVRYWNVVPSAYSNPVENPRVIYSTVTQRKPWLSREYVLLMALLWRAWITPTTSRTWLNTIIPQ